MISVIGHFGISSDDKAQFRGAFYADVVDVFINYQDNGGEAEILLIADVFQRIDDQYVGMVDLRWLGEMGFIKYYTDNEDVAEVMRGSTFRFSLTNIGNFDWVADQLKEMLGKLLAN